MSVLNSLMPTDFLHITNNRRLLRIKSQKYSAIHHVISYNGTCIHILPSQIPTPPPISTSTIQIHVIPGSEPKCDDDDDNGELLKPRKLANSRCSMLGSAFTMLSVPHGSKEAFSQYCRVSEKK